MGNIRSIRNVQGKQSYVGNINSREPEMEIQSVDDVRNEVLKTGSCSSKEYESSKSKYKEIELEIMSINDMPNEVIQKNIMTYLSDDDVRSVGRTGSKRFKVIADDELAKRGEYTFCNIFSTCTFIINYIFYLP